MTLLAPPLAAQDPTCERITKCQEEESCLCHSLPAGCVYDQTVNPSSKPRLGPIWKHKARTLSCCQDPMASAKGENMRFPLAQPNDPCLDPWKQRQGVQEDDSEAPPEARSMCLQLGGAPIGHSLPLSRDTKQRQQGSICQSNSMGFQHSAEGQGSCTQLCFYTSM